MPEARLCACLPACLTAYTLHAARGAEGVWHARFPPFLLSVRDYFRKDAREGSKAESIRGESESESERGCRVWTTTERARAAKPRSSIDRRAMQGLASITALTSGTSEYYEPRHGDIPVKWRYGTVCTVVTRTTAEAPGLCLDPAARPSRRHATSGHSSIRGRNATQQTNGHGVYAGARAGGGGR